MYSTAVIVAVITSMILGIAAFFQNALFLAIADFTFCIFVILQLILLKKTKKYDVVATIGAVIVGLFYIYLLFTGGVDNTASLWLFTYPLVTFSLLESKRGMLLNSIMFIIIIAFFFIFQNEFEAFTKYSSDYIFRFLPAYFVISIYSYLFAANREKIFNLLEHRNSDLQQTVGELKIKEFNLSELSRELEKRVEERTIELEEARKNAETSEKIKTEFLAQMSHEIRSPLNVIMSFISFIKEDLIEDITDDLETSFQSIDSASSRIIRTIDLILNMTDLQLGSYEITVKRLDILQIINRVKIEYIQSANNKNLDLILETNISNKNIYSDEYAMTQIISNLVDNAIKYTETGYIKIISYNEADNLIVSIEDTGIGMSEEFLPNLFNSFTQEEQGYSRSYDGNGLGMALVKKYCDLISVDISVKSKKGVGTTFTLIIPSLQQKN